MGGIKKSTIEKAVQYGFINLIHKDYYLPYWYSDAGNGSLPHFAVFKAADLMYYEEMPLHCFPSPPTNNEMEHRAVREALKMMPNNSILRTDSRVVIYHLLGKSFKAPQHLQEYIEDSKRLCLKKKICVEWVPRNLNFAGLYLEHKRKEQKREIKKSVDLINNISDEIIIKDIKQLIQSALDKLNQLTKRYKIKPVKKNRVIKKKGKKIDYGWI